MSRHVYSNSEFYEMMLCVGAARNNSIYEARQIYRQRFIDGRPPAEQRHLPPYSVFRNMCLRLQRTGSFHADREAAGRPTSRPADVEELILEHFDENPRTSTRRAGALFGVNHMLVWHTLHEDGQHPYHFRRTQELTPADYQPRMNFCRWYRSRAEADSSFTKKVLWTDEASFTRNGILNLHNGHVWSHTNPHASSQSNFQHQWRINVWAGIYGNRVLGPIILPARFTGPVYLNLLAGEIEDLLEDLPLREYMDVIFQHDGAAAHFERRVRGYLDARFPEWIGRGGPVPWPARSPDLTVVKYFVWGYVKKSVYAHECSTREEMEEKIHAAFASITPDMLQSARTSMLRRTELCLDKEGGHFKPFL
ncbi:hypothetical protein ABMA28_000375 [Loxostege sticticalis]|uniref:Transposase n=1 Tax=Loxostege sticticalis TaxID=481309 RepID=A0ABD0TS06_LOXSC